MRITSIFRTESSVGHYPKFRYYMIVDGGSADGKSIEIPRKTFQTLLHSDAFLKGDKMGMYHAKVIYTK